MDCTVPPAEEPFLISLRITIFPHSWGTHIYGHFGLDFEGCSFHWRCRIKVLRLLVRFAVLWDSIAPSFLHRPMKSHGKYLVIWSLQPSKNFDFSYWNLEDTIANFSYLEYLFIPISVRSVERITTLNSSLNFISMSTACLFSLSLQSLHSPVYDTLSHTGH